MSNSNSNSGDSIRNSIDLSDDRFRVIPPAPPLEVIPEVEEDFVPEDMDEESKAQLRDIRRLERKAAQELKSGDKRKAAVSVDTDVEEDEPKTPKKAAPKRKRASKPKAKKAKVSKVNSEWVKLSFGDAQRVIVEVDGSLFCFEHEDGEDVVVHKLRFESVV